MHVPDIYRIFGWRQQDLFFFYYIKTTGYLHAFTICFYYFCTGFTLRSLMYISFPSQLGRYCFARRHKVCYRHTCSELWRHLPYYVWTTNSGVWYIVRRWRLISASCDQWWKRNLIGLGSHDPWQWRGGRVSELSKNDFTDTIKTVRV